MGLLLDWVLSPKVLLCIIFGLLIAYFTQQHFNEVKDLRDSLSAAQGEVTRLEGELGEAVSANQSLNSEIGRQKDQLSDIRQELQQTRQAHTFIQGRLEAATAVINDFSRISRQERLRASRKAQLLLEVYNANVSCWAANFGRIDGHCRAGHWVPDRVLQPAG